MGTCLSFPEGIDVVRYGEIKDSLRTGDIVLFNGSGYESLWVKFGTISPWSHCGMIVRCPHIRQYITADSESFRGLPGLDDPYNDANHVDDLYLWHSNQGKLTIPDLITGERKSGVQLTPLYRALRCYDGNVCIRRLYTPEHMSHSCSEEFHHFLQENAPKPYCASVWELFLATYDGILLPENVDQFRDFFCSKLLAYTYKILGYLFLVLPASEYVPSDFAGDCDTPVALKNGVILGPLVCIDRSELYPRKYRHE